MEKEINTKVCAKCGRELPIENFNKSSHNKDGYQWWCRDCMKENYHKNREVKKTKENDSKEVNPLAEFKPRELIAELIRRGYKGTLTYTHKIEL